MIKLVIPATLALSDLSFGLSSFGLSFFGGGGGTGEGVTERRKLTLDSSRLSIPGFSSTAFSFPLAVLGVTVAKSSVEDFFDRVARLKLCSRVERMRPNGFDDDSIAEDDDGCWALDDEGNGA